MKDTVIIYKEGKTKKKLEFEKSKAQSNPTEFIIDIDNGEDITRYHIQKSTVVDVMPLRLYKKTNKISEEPINPLSGV